MSTSYTESVHQLPDGRHRIVRSGHIDFGMKTLVDLSQIKPLLRQPGDGYVRNKQVVEVSQCCSVVKFEAWDDQVYLPGGGPEADAPVLVG